MPIRPRSRPYVALGGAVAVAFVLAACSQASGEGDDDSSDDQSGLSPLEEYLGENAFGFHGEGVFMQFSGKEGEETEQQRQEAAEIEKKIQECMADEGFEYFPNSGGAEEESDPFDDAYSLPEDEFAEKYGYGLSTLEFDESGDDEDSDPNTKYRSSLSEEAQKAYDDALGGGIAVEVKDPGSGAPTVEPPSDADLGCIGKAVKEVTGEEGPPIIGAESDALMEDLEQLGERLQDDQGVIEATKAWVDCMADAGYPDFEDISGPEESVVERMDELIEASSPDENGDGNGDEESRPGVGGERPDIDPEDLKEVQKYELEVAGADFDCREEHYNDVAKEVQWKLEEEFVDQHRAELEKLRDQLNDDGVPDGGES